MGTPAGRDTRSYARSIGSTVVAVAALMASLGSATAVQAATPIHSAPPTKALTQSVKNVRPVASHFTVPKSQADTEYRPSATSWPSASGYVASFSTGGVRAAAAVKIFPCSCSGPVRVR